MGKHIRQHYIPQFILKNFSHKISKENKIYILDMCVSPPEINSVDTANTLQIENLYNKGIDETIENKLNRQCEQPMGMVVKKILSAKDKLVITRTELETIKKYMLIQIYRNLRNMEHYKMTADQENTASAKDKRENESITNFWKREIETILDNDLNESVISNMSGIQKIAQEIYNGFLMFFRTDTEFVLNDSGLVTERQQVKVPKDNWNDLIKIAEQLKQGEQLRKELENGTSYLDNMIFMPIAPNLAIVSVSVIWKFWLLKQMHEGDMGYTFVSPILHRHCELPKNKFINNDKMQKDAKGRGLPMCDTEKFKDDNDTYEYNIKNLNEQETIYVNTLMMNEVWRYLCFKTPQKIISSVKKYNQMADTQTPVIKKNYFGIVELLNKIKT